MLAVTLLDRSSSNTIVYILSIKCTTGFLTGWILYLIRRQDTHNLSTCGDSSINTMFGEMCCSSLCLALNLWSHPGHWYGLTPSCTTNMCHLRSCLAPNFVSHSWHWCALTPLCTTDMGRLRSCLSPNFLPHSGHWFDLTPWCTSEMCRLRGNFLLNFFPHSLQT